MSGSKQTDRSFQNGRGKLEGFEVKELRDTVVQKRGEERTGEVTIKNANGMRPADGNRYNRGCRKG